MAMAMQSESERSWLFDSSSACRLRFLPPRLVGGFWFISKRIICTHCSIACADKHGSCRYISSADIPISAGREQGTLGNALSMCAYANSLPQSFLFKASHFSSKRPPQSLLPKAFPQSSFLQSSLFKAPSSKPSPSKPFSQSASLKALSLLFFLFKAPSSKPLPQSLPSKPFLSKPLAQSVSLKAFSFKASSSKLSPSKLLVQSLSLLLKALSSKLPPQSISSKLFPQSLLLKAISPKPFPSKPLTQSLLLLLKAFSFKAFFLQSFFFQSFLFEAFSSKNIEGY